MDSEVANFFLIDQSLKGVGGHHFDYSYQVANVASNSHKVIIGANKRFKAFSSFPNCETRNCFRYTTYTGSSNLIGIREMVGRRKRRGSMAGWLRTIFVGDSESNDAVRKKRITTFRDNLKAFFRGEINESDAIFFTTLSDLEAEGLRQFIADRDDAKNANWHLQFHFPIFLGRTEEYAQQEFRLELVRPVFEKLELLRRETDIRYYVTSKPLREQYIRLGFEFEDLAYPIDPSFGMQTKAGKDIASAESGDPKFRLTFAGASRKEKGDLAVRELATDLPADFVRNHHIKIVIQKKKQKFWRRVKQRFQNESKTPDEAQPSIFEALRFPLSDSQYRDMIKQTQIGLLTTYDSRTYFSRRAGILGEYLAAGVPVIVPAGCWLSDQIESVQQEYLHTIVLDESKHPTKLTSTLSSDGTLEVEISDFRSPTTASNSDNTADTRLVVLSLPAAGENCSADYIHVIQMDKDGLPIDSQIVSASPIGKVPQENQSVRNDVLRFAFYAKAASCRSFKIEKAFRATNENNDNSPEFNFSKVNATILNSENPIPRSAVGMIAADSSQAAKLIQEMVSQYSHYKATANLHSKAWNRKHDPKLTFSTLLNRSHYLLKSETNDSEEKPKRTAA